MIRTAVLSSVVAIAAGTAAAQSDPANFDLVINVGNDPNSEIDFDTSFIGGGSGPIVPPLFSGNFLDSNTQANVFAGGQVFSFLRVGPTSGGENVELNIFDASIVGSNLTILPGGTANFFGGPIAFDPIVDRGTLNVLGPTTVVGVIATGGSVSVADGGAVDNLFAINGGTTVLVLDGGEIQGNNFIIENGSLTIAGGTVSAPVSFSGVTLELSSGAIGLFEGSGSVLVSGGVIGNTDTTEGGFRLIGNQTNPTQMTMTGGTAFNGDIGDNNILNFSGGTMAGFAFRTGFFSIVNYSGGAFDAPYFAAPQSTLNITGREFFLGGQAIDGLTFGEPFEITQRGIGLTLSGTLQSGEPFELDLTTNSFLGGDEFPTSADVNVILVPTPCNPADVDESGGLSFADVTTFVDAFSAASEAADVNDDGMINFADVSGFIAAFNQGCP